MKLLLIREEARYSKLHGDFTIGKFYVDGKFFCYSLEDKVRKPGELVPGKTAIPAGTYPVSWGKSPRLSKQTNRDYFTPRIDNIPGWQGVLIHTGNFPKDTVGCILIGLELYSDGIGKSQKACDWLFPKVQNSQPDCTIEIRNEFKLLNT